MPGDRAERRIEIARGGESTVLHAGGAQLRVAAPGEDECTVLHVDAQIVRVATVQDGVMSRAQLADVGLGRGAIRHRLETGEFTRLFRGVFAIGRTAVSPRGWARAALLAVGPDAVLSHRSAAFVWGLADPPPTVHVSVAGRRLRPRPGLTPHTVVAYLPDEVRTRDAALAALGYVVVRFTWRQLERRPLLVAARLAQVLAVRAAVPG